MATVSALAGVIAEQQYAVLANHRGPLEDGPFGVARVGSGDYVTGPHRCRPPDDEPVAWLQFRRHAESRDLHPFRVPPRPPARPREERCSAKCQPGWAVIVTGAIACGFVLHGT